MLNLSRSDRKRPSRPRGDTAYRAAAVAAALMMLATVSFL